MPVQRGAQPPTFLWQGGSLELNAKDLFPLKNRMRSLVVFEVVLAATSASLLLGHSERSQAQLGEEVLQQVALRNLKSCLMRWPVICRACSVRLIWR